MYIYYVYITHIIHMNVSIYTHRNMHIDRFVIYIYIYAAGSASGCVCNCLTIYSELSVHT